jgi:hypothetical protein
MKTNQLVFLLVLYFLSVVSCTSSNDFEIGKQQLEQSGYTNVVNTGYSMFCCSKDDDFSTGFKCKNKKGEIVTGCFCSTLLKGVTIRFN